MTPPSYVKELCPDFNRKVYSMGKCDGGKVLLEFCLNAYVHVHTLCVIQKYLFILMCNSI